MLIQTPNENILLNAVRRFITFLPLFVMWLMVMPNTSNWFHFGLMRYFKSTRHSEQIPKTTYFYYTVQKTTTVKTE